MQKRRRLGGARYSKPHEVHDTLRALGRPYNGFYDAIMRNAIIRWDYDGDDVWVEGRFRALPAQMARWTELSKSSFYIKWRKIIDAGLIRVEEDGVFVVTMVIKKEDVGISDAEVRRMQEQQLEMSEEFQEMKENFQRVTAILEELKAEKTESEYREGVRLNGRIRPLGRTDPSTGPDSPILLKGLKKENSLSGNKIISGFYKGIGQKRIAKEKRERALKVFRNLRKEEFSLEDIAFAVEWTLENTKEEIYDFAIIQHTIGQAIAARDKQESDQREVEKREKAVEEERAKREAEEQEREQIERYKASLSPENRAALRERAEAEISASGKYNSALISEPLIAAKENEIVRKQLEEKW